MRTGMRFFTMAFVAATIVACDHSTGPVGSAPVSLSFLIHAGTGPNLSLMAVTLNDGQGNALEIENVEIVLRDIEFERTEAVADCDDPADDACEEVKVGPEIATLPLDATAPVALFQAAVPVGSFDEIEFEVHKLDADDPEDQPLVTQRPEFDRISILVAGTWMPAGSGAVPFTFASDLNEEQEIEFASPLVVVEGEAKNVTFVVDLDAWFRGSGGALVDPESANKGQVNENLVRDNIRDSIDAFEDNDRDGSDDA